MNTTANTTTNAEKADSLRQNLIHVRTENLAALVNAANGSIEILVDEPVLGHAYLSTTSGRITGCIYIFETEYPAGLARRSRPARPARSEFMFTEGCVEHKFNTLEEAEAKAWDWAVENGYFD